MCAFYHKYVVACVTFLSLCFDCFYFFHSQEPFVGTPKTKCAPTTRLLLHLLLFFFSFMFCYCALSLTLFHI